MSTAVEGGVETDRWQSFTLQWMGLTRTPYLRLQVCKVWWHLVVNVWIGRIEYLLNRITSICSVLKSVDGAMRHAANMYYISLAAAAAWPTEGPEKMRPISWSCCGWLIRHVAVSVKWRLGPVTDPLPQRWKAVLSIDQVWSKCVWSERADQALYRHLLALYRKSQIKDNYTKRHVAHL